MSLLGAAIDGEGLAALLQQGDVGVVQRPLPLRVRGQVLWVGNVRKG